jgi:hypothetical protein
MSREVNQLPPNLNCSQSQESPPILRPNLAKRAIKVEHEPLEDVIGRLPAAHAREVVEKTPS